MIVGGVIMSRREDLNRIEVINKGDKVIFINTYSWDDRNYDIKYFNETSKVKHVILSGEKKQVTIDNVVIGENYTYVVSRKDVIGKIMYKSTKYNIMAMWKKYVVLIGASIGKTWNLPFLALRKNNINVDYGYRGTDSFDKEEVIMKLLNTKIRPDIVIIKECAAYFPRDTNESIRKILVWVELLQKENIVPVLATTVPVTKYNDNNNKGRQNSINEFNNMIREYAYKNGLPVLDLQQVVEDKSEKHYLREEFAATDGLHLNKRAYNEFLDEEIMNIAANEYY